MAPARRSENRNKASLNSIPQFVLARTIRPMALSPFHALGPRSCADDAGRFPHVDCGGDNSGTGSVAHASGGQSHYRAAGIVDGRCPADRRGNAGHAPTHIRNEIGTLAKAFESMNRQLTGRIADLQSQRLKLQNNNNEQLETVLAMVEGVIAVNDQVRIILWNSAAFRLLELTPMAMRRGQSGRPCDSRGSMSLSGGLKGEMTERIEIQVARVQTNISAAASRLPGEPCPGAVLVLHDVTELRRLATSRREFVANVSHELKTPLSSIAAYTETLLDGAMDDPEHNRSFWSASRSRPIDCRR